MKDVFESFIAIWSLALCSVKSVRIRGYSGPHFFPHFPAFGLNTERFSDTPYVSVFSPNAGKCGKNADQNNSEDGHFLRSFGDLLDKDKSVSIHLQNIQKLGIEIFKVLKGENAQIVNEVFFRHETFYELRQRSFRHIPSINTVFSGTESIRFLGPKIWELILNDIKCLENLKGFQNSNKEMETNIMPM